MSDPDSLFSIHMHSFDNTVYVSAGTTNSGTPTAGAGGFGGPCGSDGKFAIANAITITIWRGVFYIFFLLRSLDGVILTVQWFHHCRRLFRCQKQGGTA